MKKLRPGEIIGPKSQLGAEVKKKPRLKPRQSSGLACTLTTVLHCLPPLQLREDGIQ